MTRPKIAQKKNLFIVTIGALVALGSFLFIYKNIQSAQKQTTQPSLATKQSVVNYIGTVSSIKPRDKIITYTVERGDTLDLIARKFNISADTIKWANNLTTDDVEQGQTLKILPVTGIAHTVIKGETIQSLAALYHTDKQKIVDYPFNHFTNAENFILAEGEIVIIPDGKP